MKEGSNWEGWQIKMAMLKTGGIFPENWRRNDLEGVLGNKKGGSPLELEDSRTMLAST